MKQRRHLSLILILCWPSRSPCNNSKRFPGGDRKSIISTALSSICNLRPATFWKFLNLLDWPPSYIAWVSEHLKDLIVIYYNITTIVKRQTINIFIEKLKINTTRIENCTIVSMREYRPDCATSHKHPCRSQIHSG